MEWQDARECVKAYCSNHDISLNHSEIKDFEDGTLTAYEPEFDLYPIEMSWRMLFNMILAKERLDKDMSKEMFMIWNDTCIAA